MATGSTWTPDAEQWTIAEDEYFWCELVPRSKWGIPPLGNPIIEEDAVAEAMRRKFGSLGLRPYTEWSISTHYQDGMSGRLVARDFYTLPHFSAVTAHQNRPEASDNS